MCRRNPDATRAELVEWSAAKRGVTVCVATTWATLEALGVTLKKDLSRRRARARGCCSNSASLAQDLGRAQHQYLSSSDDADALPGRNERNHPHDGPGKATVLSLGLQQRARQIGILRLSAYSRQPTIVRRGPRL